VGVADGFGAEVININGNGAVVDACALTPHADKKIAEINKRRI
jgi:hypothetical protein